LFFNNRPFMVIVLAHDIPTVRLFLFEGQYIAHNLVRYVSARGTTHTTLSHVCIHWPCSISARLVWVHNLNFPTAFYGSFSLLHAATAAR